MNKNIKPVTLIKLKFIFCLILIIAYVSLSAQKQLLYPKLKKGQYDVGYKTMIELDNSRSYDLNYPNTRSSLNHDPRPVLVNVWYPAGITSKDRPMLYGDYIKVQTQDPKLKTFINRIETYNTRNSAEYMFDLDSLNDLEKKAFKE